MLNPSAERIGTMDTKPFEGAGENAALVEELFIVARVAMLRMERQYPVQIAQAFTAEERETLQQARHILGALDSEVLAILESRGTEKKTP